MHKPIQDMSSTPLSLNVRESNQQPDTYRPDLEGGILRSTTQEQRIQQRR